ncbi:hypothetical protein OLV04_08360 [Campylobacter jejuni]|nr:hypothetical protein [Campylobacter jejuni]
MQRLKKTKEVKSFAHQKELYTWQKSLDDMVDEVLIKDNQKYPINFIQVGKMDKSTKEFLEKLNKKRLRRLILYTEQKQSFTRKP